MTHQEEHFIECCINRDLKTIETQVKHGLNIHVEDNIGARFAAYYGNLEILKYLISLGVTHESLAKRNLLSHVCSRCQKKIVKYLVDESNAYKNESSLIDWTLAAGNLEIFSIIIGYAENKRRLFALTIFYNRFEILQFLLDNELQNLNSDFEKSFEQAIINGNLPIADYLVANGYFSEDNVKSETWETYLKLKKGSNKLI